MLPNIHNFDKATLERVGNNYNNNNYYKNYLPGIMEGIEISAFFLVEYKKKSAYFYVLLPSKSSVALNKHPSQGSARLVLISQLS